MAVAGAILALLGLVLILPPGSTPGSVAARNVPVGTSHIERTPGPQRDLGGRESWALRAVGLAVLGAGAVLLMLGL